MERTHYRSVSSRTLVYMYRPIRLMYIRLRINHVTPMSGAYTIHYTRGVRARYVVPCLDWLGVRTAGSNVAWSPHRLQALVFLHETYTLAGIDTFVYNA